MQYLQNPRSHHVKKFIHEILHERYFRHEQLLERVSHYLVTDSDVEQFSKFVSDIYETAYLKAIDDHKEALARHGLKATIAPPKSPAAGQK
jgi:hypothetical protein